MDPQWLDWAKRLRAIAQSGDEFAGTEFDRERYEQVREIAAEIMAHHTGAGMERVEALFDRETGYATPKLGVRACVFQDDRILMVRERQDGLWSPPGGWVDVGDSGAEAAAKEVQQESGLETQAARLLAVYDLHKQPFPPLPQHVHLLCFECRLVGGRPEFGIETDAARFFSLDALPDLSPERITPEMLAHLFELHRHPDRPTYFD